MSRVGSVVLVDDDDDARAATRQMLELSGFAVEAFGEARRALERLRTDQDSIVITDIRMPGMSGLELLAELRRRDAALPVILITGHGDVDTAVAALKGGAWDFLTKPFDPDLLVAAARRAAEARALTIDNRRLREAAAAGLGRALLGETPVMRRLRAMLPRLVESDLDLAIEGESGTGKTLLALTVHRMSRRSRHRLEVIDCLDAGLRGQVATAGLFDRSGQVARAHRGTLLLAGLQYAPEALQFQLARFAARRTVAADTRAPEAVDVRIIAILGEQGGDDILPELYHRISAAKVRMPSLAERRDDIALLFTALVLQTCEDRGCPIPETGDLAHRLASREWPGNVRELRNFAERICLGLEVDELDSIGTATLNERLDAYERRLIVEALVQTEGGVTRAAEDLGLPRKTFYNRLARLGIDPRALRER